MVHRETWNLYLPFLYSHNPWQPRQPTAFKYRLIKLWTNTVEGFTLLNLENSCMATPTRCALPALNKAYQCPDWSVESHMAGFWDISWEGHMATYLNRWHLARDTNSNLKDRRPYHLWQPPDVDKSGNFRNHIVVKDLSYITCSEVSWEGKDNNDAKQNANWSHSWEKSHCCERSAYREDGKQVILAAQENEW